MTVDLKSFYEQNKSYFGDKPLSDVAQEAYQKSGAANTHSYDEWLDWTGTGRQQIEEDRISREPPSSFARRAIADPLVSLIGKGGMGIVDTATGLADLASAGMVGKGLNALQGGVRYERETIDGGIAPLF